MSAAVHWTPKSGRQSQFFQDLATPVSSRRSEGKLTTPGQAAAVSALRRENFSNSDLPPPPIFTLEDRSNFSPDSRISDYLISPEVKSDPRTPVQSSVRDFSTPTSKPESSTSYGIIGKQQQQQQQNPVVSLSWWSPVKLVSNTEQDDKGKSSPVEGVIQPGALITLPPPREVARPEIKKSLVPMENLDEEEWVTVYGFSPADTNLVLREFEKCGVILKHVPGPREANWMHILYQNRFDARKALSKNGMEINGVLIIGVKPVDPIECRALNERLNYQGFMPLPLAPSNGNSTSNGFNVSPHPYYPQNGSSGSRESAGTIATPAKSIASKVMDLMFGF